MDKGCEAFAARNDVGRDRWEWNRKEEQFRNEWERLTME